jgi:hypothetical protein
LSVVIFPPPAPACQGSSPTRRRSATTIKGRPATRSERPRFASPSPSTCPSPPSPSLTVRPLRPPPRCPPSTSRTRWGMRYPTTTTLCGSAVSARCRSSSSDAAPTPWPCPLTTPPCVSISTNSSMKTVGARLLS